MKGDVRLLQEEIRALAARQDSMLIALRAELRAESRSTQDTLRTQADQIFDFRGDISQSMRQISQSLTRLEAIAGENQRAISQLRSQMADLQRAPAGGDPVTGGETPAGGENLLPGGAGNPEEIWEAAFEQYDRGSYSTAAVALEDFIDQFPSDPRVANARFYLGDILETQDQHEEALTEYERVLSLFPTSSVTPTAMFRAAVLMHEHLDRDDDARAMLERIMNTYPGDPIAALARDELEAIGERERS